MFSLVAYSPIINLAHVRIMHVVACVLYSVYHLAVGLTNIHDQVARRPSDPQASLGLTRCIEACKRLEVGSNHLARLE